MDAFKSAEGSRATCEKLHHFLQEVHTVHGRKFEVATVPAS